MFIKACHPGFRMPQKASTGSAAYDLFMPESGYLTTHPKLYGLGFSAAVPENHVALLLPRSSTGAKFGVTLANTIGVIDPDYRGEWKVVLYTTREQPYHWTVGERLIQMLILPCQTVSLQLMDNLPETIRNTGGFGSSGK